MTAVSLLDAAVHAGLAAYVDGFEGQRETRAPRPPKRFSRGALRQMWIHGWNAGVEVELLLRGKLRPAARAAAA